MLSTLTLNKSAAVDWPTLLKMMAGGAAIGAGAGAATTYARHLKTLQERAAAQGDTSYDDDVLYLNMPPKPGQPKPQRRTKAAAANSTGTFALGGLSGLLGLYLGYSGVRGQYQKARKKQLQAELDRAQQVYLGSLSQSADKSAQTKAAGQFSAATKLIGGGQLAAMLMLLGSAAVTNRVLQKQLPPISNPASDRLRKIVIRSRGQEDQTVPAGGIDDPEDIEQLAHNHLENKTAAALSGIADLVAAISLGRADEIKANITEYGLDAMFDSIKGARFEKTSAVKNQLAITFLARDPFLAAACGPLLAAEFFDWSPGTCKIAAHIDSCYHEPLIGMARASACRRREVLCQQLGWDKSAGVKDIASPLKDLFIVGTLAHIFSNDPNEDDDESGGGNSPRLTGVTPSADSPNKTNNNLPLEASDNDAANFAKRHQKLLQSLGQN